MLVRGGRCRIVEGPVCGEECVRGEQSVGLWWLRDGGLKGGRGVKGGK